MTGLAAAPEPERAPAVRREWRCLLVDVGVIVCAAAVRVGVERLRGLEHAGGDLGTLFMPNLAWWWSAVRGLGGWNPWIFGGYPGNADPQIGQLHPFGLLYAVAPPLAAATLDGVLSPAAAGVGMLLYLRAIGCSRTGRLVGALSFALGGFIAAQASHPAHTRAALAVPWALAAIESLGGWALVAGLGCATAAIVVGGHPQVIVYALAIVVAYAVWLGRPHVHGRAPAIVAAVVLGSAVGAGMWLPAAGLIRQSTYGVDAVAEASGPGDMPGRLTAVHAAGLVVPYAPGGAAGAPYGPSRENLVCSVTECGGYPGMLVWLALLAGAPTLVRDRRGRFWLVVGVAGVVLASGVLGVMPPVREVRAPARTLLLFDVAAAAAAGIALGWPRAGVGPTPRAWAIAAAMLAVLVGWASVQDPVARRAAIASAVVLASTTAVVLATRTGSRQPGRWLVAVAALDLLVFSASVPIGVPPSTLGGMRAMLDFIAARDDRDPLDRALILPFFAGANWGSVRRVPLLQGYNALVPHAVASLLGYDPALRAIEVGWVMDGRLAAAENHALDLLRCRHVLTLAWAKNDAAWQAFATAAGGDGARWERDAHDGPSGARVYRNRRARPVAWLVDRVRVVPGNEALAIVRGSDATFDPRSEALVDAPVAGLVAGGDQAPVRVVAYADDTIALAAEAAAPSLLVTSELAYPGWTVAIDGRPAPILTVNAAFRGVAMPAGRHDVVFRYRPIVAKVGLAITALAAAALAAAAVRARQRRTG